MKDLNDYSDEFIEVISDFYNWSTDNSAWRVKLECPFFKHFYVGVSRSNPGSVYGGNSLVLSPGICEQCRKFVNLAHYAPCPCHAVSVKGALWRLGRALDKYYEEQDKLEGQGNDLEQSNDLEL